MSLVQKPISLREAYPTKFDKQAEDSFHHLKQHYELGEQSYLVQAKGASLKKDIYKIEQTSDSISVKYKSWKRSHKLLSIFHSSGFKEVKLTDGEKYEHRHRKYVYKVVMTSGQFSANKVANSINELLHSQDKQQLIELISFMSDSYAADVLKHLMAINKEYNDESINQVFADIINSRPELATRILLDDGLIPESRDICFSDCFIERLALMKEASKIKPFFLDILKPTKPVKKALLLHRLCKNAFYINRGLEPHNAIAKSILNEHLKSLRPADRNMTLRLLKHIDSKLFDTIKEFTELDDIDFVDLKLRKDEIPHFNMVKKTIVNDRNKYTLHFDGHSPQKAKVEITTPKSTPVTQQPPVTQATSSASVQQTNPTKGTFKIDTGKPQKVSSSDQEYDNPFDIELKTIKITEAEMEDSFHETSTGLVEPSTESKYQAPTESQQQQDDKPFLDTEVNSESTPKNVTSKPSIPKPTPISKALLTEDAAYSISKNKAFKRLVLMNFYQEKAWGSEKSDQEVESAYMDLVEQGAFRPDKVIKNIERAIKKVINQPTRRPGSDKQLMAQLNGSTSQIAQRIFDKYIDTETGYFDDAAKNWQQDIFKGDSNLAFNASILIKPEVMSCIFTSMGIDSYIDTQNKSTDRPKLYRRAQGDWLYVTKVEKQVLGITYTLSEEEIAKIETENGIKWEQYHKAKLEKAGFTNERMPLLRASIDLALKPFLPKETNLSTKIALRNKILSNMVKRYSTVCTDDIIWKSLSEHKVAPVTAKRIADNINKVVTTHKPLSEKDTLKVVQSTLKHEQFNEHIPSEEEFSNFCKRVTSIFYSKGIYKPFTARNLRAFFPIDCKLPSEEVFEKVAESINQNIREKEHIKVPTAKPLRRGNHTPVAARNYASQRLPSANRKTQTVFNTPPLSREEIQRNVYQILMQYAHNLELREYLPVINMPKYSQEIAKLYYQLGTFQPLSADMLVMAYPKKVHNLPPMPLLNAIASEANSLLTKVQNTPLDQPARPIGAVRPQLNANQNGIIQHSNGSQTHLVKGNGDCFFRAVLAIKLKDPSWCQGASKAQIMQHPHAREILNEKTRTAINSAVKVMDEVLPETHETLAHIAQHLEVQPEDLGNAIYEACYANGSFALYSPKTLALQLLPQHLQNDSATLNNLMILAETIGGIQSEQFDIPVVTPQTKNIQQLLTKHGAVITSVGGNHLDILVKNDYF